MHKGQVFVRAKLPNGKWVSADALDLEQGSFNAFILGRLAHAGLVYSLTEPEGEEVTFKVREDRAPLYRKEE
jgi:hypothetical protein